MSENKSSQTLELNGWTLRQRLPDGPGPHPVTVMLHGWTGDENAMWVFAPRLPKDQLLLSPRGLYPTPLGGFGWHAHKPKAWPWVDDFRTAMDALLDLLDRQNWPGADLGQVRLVGFSQGAALAFTFAMYYPWRVRALASLSGFLPDGAQALTRNQPLKDKPVFLAHGAQDDLVPLARARLAVELLQQAGARLTYCQDDVGHKLSASCFRGFEAFFQAN
ncbi:MAG: alpha/beta fold hydrolase [Chloroflexi bacterium]|nr:alpha/beta fold hydrolase [Chloroflexota bacterium]